MTEATIKLTSVAADTLKEMRPSARTEVIELLKTKLGPFVRANPPSRISDVDGDFWVIRTKDDGPVVVATVHGDPAEPNEYVITALLNDDSQILTKPDLTVDRDAIDLGREVLSHSTMLNS